MTVPAVVCSTGKVLSRAANSLSASGQSTHRQLLPASTWMTVMVGVSCLLMAISRSFSSLTWATVLLVVTPVGLLILQLLIGRQYGDQPSAALAAGAIVAQLGMIELVSQLDGQSIASLLYLALPFPAVFWLGARVGLVVSAVAVTLFTVRFAAAKPQWRTDPDDLHSYLLFVIAVVLVTATALLVRRERISREQAERLLRDLGASHRQLVESQGRVAELATIEERNRLARDIHDSLGHHLTVISVQLEKAQLLVAEDPVAVSAAVANAKRLADQALADVRQSVGALRKDEAPFLLEPTLRGMVAEGAPGCRSPFPAPRQGRLEPMETSGSIRLLIVDDQELMRDGLTAILERQPGIEVVAAAADGAEALRLVEELAPDVVLMDVRMPVLDGVQATAEIVRTWPAVKVVMLSTFDDDDHVTQALQVGAVGYLLKNLPAQDLAEAVRLASRGVLQLAPAAAAKVVAALSSAARRSAPAEPPAELARLTDREREVLRLVAVGANNREIARDLVISEGTVKSHISSILGQLNLRDRTQLAVFVHQHLPGR